MAWYDRFNPFKNAPTVAPLTGSSTVESTDTFDVPNPGVFDHDPNTSVNMTLSPETGKLVGEKLPTEDAPNYTFEITKNTGTWRMVGGRIFVKMDSGADILCLDAADRTNYWSISWNIGSRWPTLYFAGQAIFEGVHSAVLQTIVDECILKRGSLDDSGTYSAKFTHHTRNKGVSVDAKIPYDTYNVYLKFDEDSASFVDDESKILDEASDRAEADDDSGESVETDLSTHA